jgi:hypothetical protein
VRSDLEATVAALEERVRRLEDEVGVRRAIMLYGLHVDSNDGQGAAETFTPDGLYDVDFGPLSGRAEVQAYLDHRGEREGKTAHLVGPELIEFPSRDRASVVGYSMVLVRRGGEIHLWRGSLNHWDLVRDGAGWLVERRTTRPVGDADAPAVLRRGLPR